MWMMMERWRDGEMMLKAWSIFYEVKRMIRRSLRYPLRFSLSVTMQGCGTVVK